MNLSLVHLIYKLWTDIDKWLYVVSIVDNIAQRNNKTIKSKNLKNKKSWLHPSLGHGWLVQNLWTLHVKWSHHHLCQSRPSSKCFTGITNLLWRDLAITIGIKKLENAFPIGYILWIRIRMSFWFWSCTENGDWEVKGLWTWLLNSLYKVRPYLVYGVYFLLTIRPSHQDNIIHNWFTKLGQVHFFPIIWLEVHCL